MKSIEAVASFLSKEINPPDGYGIRVDRKTRNILVTGPTLGFCITAKYVVDHADDDLLRSARIVFDRLVALESGDHPLDTNIRMYPVAELKNQPGTTAFDPQ